MKDVSDYIIKSEDGNFYLDAASADAILPSVMTVGSTEATLSMKTVMG